MLAAFAKDDVLLHCPCWWFSDSTVGRFAFLRPFVDEHRMCVVYGLPRGPVGRRCIWLCLCRNRQVMARLVGNNLLRFDAYIPPEPAEHVAAIPTTVDSIFSIAHSLGCL